MLFGGFLGALASLIAMAIHLQHNARREPLPQEEGVQAVGPLLDRLTTDIYRVTELRSRLTDLLPRLQPQDASLLEPRHYELLNAHLHSYVARTSSWQGGEKAYLLAILDAYSRIGDLRAIRDVTRIAQNKVTSVLRDAEVSAAAQHCLLHLREEEVAMQQRETLMRASEKPLGQETLLRPIAFVKESDPAQLLRPADEDANDCEMDPLV